MSDGSECLCCSCTVTSTSPFSPRVLAVLSRPKSAGHAQLCTCIAKFGYLAKSDANTACEAKEFDKITSVDNDTMLIDDPDLDGISDLSKTHENIGLFGVLTMFESSVSNVSHDDFCSSKRKQRKHAIVKPLLDKKENKKKVFVINAAESMSKKG